MTSKQSKSTQNYVVITITLLIFLAFLLLISVKVSVSVNGTKLSFTDWFTGTTHDCYNLGPVLDILRRRNITVYTLTFCGVGL